MLRFLQGLSVAETADVMARSEGRSSSCSCAPSAAWPSSSGAGRHEPHRASARVASRDTVRNPLPAVVVRAGPDAGSRTATRTGQGGAAAMSVRPVTFRRPSGGGPASLPRCSTGSRTGHRPRARVAGRSDRDLMPEQFSPGRQPARGVPGERCARHWSPRQPAASLRGVRARARGRRAARQHRVRRIVATGVLASLVGGVGAAAASTHALPGDALYGLKRGIETVAAQLRHSDLSRGRDLLDQADDRLSEAEALAASEDARYARRPRPASPRRSPTCTAAARAGQRRRS